jgi:hypothetical protein
MAHIDMEVRVQQELELEGFCTLVAHVQHSLKAVFAQRHAVYEPEAKWPCLLRVLAQARCRKTKVEFDRIIATLALDA